MYYIFIFPNKLVLCFKSYAFYSWDIIENDLLAYKSGTLDGINRMSICCYKCWNYNSLNCFNKIISATVYSYACIDLPTIHSICSQQHHT